MTAKRLSRPIVLAVALLPIAAAPALGQGGPTSYSIDVLDESRYPQLKDSWMTRINNNGVAAGYIATQSALGPYLPTTYTGGGQFHTLGNQSVGAFQYFNLVTGINDRGDVVGQVANADNSRSAYVDRGGTIQTIGPIAGAGNVFVEGINNAGVAYGEYRGADGFSKVFTTTGATATPLNFAIAGIDRLSTGNYLLTDGGLLGLYAASASYSTVEALVVNLNTSAYSVLAVPAGMFDVNILRIAATGIYGYTDTDDYSVSRLGAWNLDGSFRGYVAGPGGIDIDDPYDVVFNGLGQALYLYDGKPWFFDGSTWSPRLVVGPGSNTLAEIDDFNDRGDFVGLADNGARGFVATVVPEPSSLAMVAVAGATGLAVAAGRRLRRGGR